MGLAGKERVLGAAGKKGQYSSSDGSRENVSVMVTIGARGVSIPPFVIFKGHAFMVDWFLRPNTSNAKISYSKKGYMTGEVGLEWIKHFDQYASPSAQGRARLLLVDGHVSHYSLDLLNYAREHNIILACYPSHTTHVLQGLDVACFARLKQLYARYATEHERTKGFKVTKSTFLEPFSRAYTETFTPETIRSAFSSTGIHPFNRNIVSAETMAPSLPTSTQSSLPLTLPDAVTAIAHMWAIDPALHAGNHQENCNRSAVNSEKEDTEHQDVQVESLEAELQLSGEAQAPNILPSTNLNELVVNTSASFLANDVPITAAQSLVPLPFHHLPPLPNPTLALGVPMTPLETQLAAELKVYRDREHNLQQMYEGAQA
ncbi:DDE superfamily endonuclease [Rhizoctonia solani 123E]|uniref:DDE superfamily endonuclease n=1 Tax=Rhizoctonia solani 123E TaxID=1423351 RepID=A0A074RI10_9AGAM|nr:DDE superfamily endonuclease [Rhizoctonia solani 123E]